MAVEWEGCCFGETESGSYGGDGGRGLVGGSNGAIQTSGHRHAEPSHQPGSGLSRPTDRQGKGRSAARGAHGTEQDSTRGGSGHSECPPRPGTPDFEKLRLWATD